MKTTWIKFTLVAALLIGFALPMCALEGFIVIANPSVPVDSIGADALKDIYTGKTKYWDGGQNVVIAVLPDKTDAGLKSVCGMDTGEFKTYWQRLAFSGRGQEPKRASDEAGLVSLVSSTKGAIAIAPAGVTVTGVKTITVK